MKCFEADCECEEDDDDDCHTIKRIIKDQRRKTGTCE